MPNRKIVLATNNAGKLREFQQMFAEASAGLSPTIVPQSDFAISPVAETGLTFVENAIIKARHACQHSKLPAIADDSGLVVDALRGAPGVLSARYAGEEGDDEANNRLLLENLKHVPETQRSARFHCALVYMQHEADAIPVVCQASWEGQILFAPRGVYGFGYDPLFYLPYSGCSSAELEPEQKNRISHRGQALRMLLDELSF